MNNNVDNLEFVTASENMQHAYDIGLHKCKISDEDARFIIQNYKERDPHFGQMGLAKRFGVSRSAIQHVLTGRNKGKATKDLRA